MGVAYQNLAFLQRQAGALPDSLATYAEARRRGVLDEPLDCMRDGLRLMLHEQAV